MSKQVDVLAILNRAADSLDYAPSVDEMVLAIDAVSKLIEAAQFALDKAWEYGEEEPHFAKLNAALSAVKGESA